MNKYVIIALWLAVFVAAGTGCSKKGKAAKAGAADFRPAVTDIAPVASATPAFQPAAPVFEPAGPVTTFTPAPAPTQLASAAAGSYQVKRGDTLFGIAKAHYGDGKQWNRIASANPGLSPQSLKAGQTIVVP